MKILAQIGICVFLGIVLGMAFWLCDGGKTRPKVSKCPGDEIKRMELDFKIYQGRWVEDIVKVGDYWSVGYLEVIK